MKDPAKKPPRAARTAAEEKLDEEIEESFPASDPPANTPTSAGGPERPRRRSARQSASPGDPADRLHRPTGRRTSHRRHTGSRHARSPVSLSTTANRGPCLISAISASTRAGGPRTSASTAPSDRLRTQPETFSLSAARRVNSRYPTPCTAPSTTRRRTRVDSFGAVIAGTLRNSRRQVWQATKRRRS